MTITRRELLTGSALAMIGTGAGTAAEVTGGLPWKPNAGAPPLIESPGPWQFFTAQEAACLEAIADRVIPPDPETPGGKDAGCAVFIDRQLAGAYGAAGGSYKTGPFLKGEKNQGPQAAQTPDAAYRAALAALNAASQASHQQDFSALPPDTQDVMLRAVEYGSQALGAVDGKEFFTMLLKDLQEGFFSDPVYGGNKDMCAWKMIGYPGAHYDYRDWVGRHNERYPYPPVSIAGRPGWTPKGR